MSLVETWGLKALRCLDPERAHGLAITTLKFGLAPLPKPYVSPHLEIDLAGLKLPNPLGLAAGFDKNAEAITPLLRAGFGFVEVGAVTPKPQPGNPRPRLFRLSEDHAIINRFGFNSDGMEVVAQRLENRTDTGIVGINLGANKDSEDRSADFGTVLKRCGAHVEFATVNVSSPNTERLRAMQGETALREVLTRTQDANATLPSPVPLFVKIAPDLTADEVAQIVRVAEDTHLSGIIATNTTLSRGGVRSRHRTEQGGLSGRPLFERSTEILRQVRQHTSLPLIGVGGISNAGDARAKLAAGAIALQLYSALVYQGLSLVPRILQALDTHADADRSSAG